ncbi:MFS transporter [Streptomyces sp. N2-109]|uniref:MFS transporter n=1 Tax=Streptomyces gossypii TaxID=2883101 RepID=A0ABT2K0B5_9ACTN|nr:MFS transporter [Streptomyces gossypii]MCT2593074.1 MFS transporter [Streptomyces gossypii]
MDAEARSRPGLPADTAPAPDPAAPAPDRAAPDPSRARWAVPVLGFATFAVGTDEFVLAGVLPEISDGLDVPVAAAGQVVTVFALTCAVLAPVLSTVLAARSRRAVLLSALAVCLLGNIATALAPGFGWVLGAQVVAAAGAGLFVPTAAVTAAALVPKERQGRAIAAVTTGFTAATALGAPIGTVIGGALGWRATMWFVAALAVLGLLGVRTLVPARVPAAAPAGLRQRLRPLREPRVLALLGATLAGFTAVYIPYTYMAVVFEPATGGSAGRLAALLFTLGVVGTLGNMGAGAIADRIGGRRVVGGALVWLIGCLLVMPTLIGGFTAGVAVIVLYGAAAFALTTPQQHRLITLDPAAAPVLVSLNAAILYLAIALSGVLGAAGIGWAGAHALPYFAAGLAAVALLLSELAHRLTRTGPR